MKTVLNSLVVLAFYCSFHFPQLGYTQQEQYDSHKSLELSVFAEFGSPSEEGLLAVYKIPMKKSLLRLGVYAQREYQPFYQLTQVAEHNLRFRQDSGKISGYGIRIGIEKQKPITDKLHFFYAFDVIGGYSRSNVISRTYEGGSVVMPVEEYDKDIRSFQLGLAPHTGLRLWLGRTFGFHLQVHTRAIAEVGRDVNSTIKSTIFELNQHSLYVQGGTVWRF